MSKNTEEQLHYVRLVSHVRPVVHSKFLANDEGAMVALHNNKAKIDEVEQILNELNKHNQGELKADNADKQGKLKADNQDKFEETQSYQCEVFKDNSETHNIDNIKITKEIKLSNRVLKSLIGKLESASVITEINPLNYGLEIKPSTTLLAIYRSDLPKSINRISSKYIEEPSFEALKKKWGDEKSAYAEHDILSYKAIEARQYAQWQPQEPDNLVSDCPDFISHLKETFQTMPEVRLTLKQRGGCVSLLKYDANQDGVRTNIKLHRISISELYLEQNKKCRDTYKLLGKQSLKEQEVENEGSNSYNEDEYEDDILEQYNFVSPNGSLQRIQLPKLYLKVEKLHVTREYLDNTWSGSNHTLDEVNLPYIKYSCDSTGKIYIHQVKITIKDALVPLDSRPIVFNKADTAVLDFLRNIPCVSNQQAAKDIMQVANGYFAASEYSKNMSGNMSKLWGRVNSSRYIQKNLDDKEGMYIFFDESIFQKWSEEKIGQESLKDLLANEDSKEEDIYDKLLRVVTEVHRASLNTLLEEESKSHKILKLKPSGLIKYIYIKVGPLLQDALKIGTDLTFSDLIEYMQQILNVFGMIYSSSRDKDVLAFEEHILNLSGLKHLLNIYKTIMEPIEEVVHKAYKHGVISFNELPNKLRQDNLGSKKAADIANDLEGKLLDTKKYFPDVLRAFVQHTCIDDREDEGDMQEEDEGGIHKIDECKISPIQFAPAPTNNDMNEAHTEEPYEGRMEEVHYPDVQQNVAGAEHTKQSQDNIDFA